MSSQKLQCSIYQMSRRTLFHLPQPCLPAESRHLCQSCDSWTTEMSDHVFTDERRILICVIEHVRTWSDYAHIAFEYIEELRQFVNIGLPHEVAECKLPRVVFRGLCLVSILVYVHRAKLIAHERIAVESCSFLFEEYRSWTLNLYDNCNDRYQWEQADTCERAEYDVETPLDELVRRIEQWL